MRPQTLKHPPNGILSELTVPDERYSEPREAAPNHGQSGSDPPLSLKSLVGNLPVALQSRELHLLVGCPKRLTAGRPVKISFRERKSGAVSCSGTKWFW